MKRFFRKIERRISPCDTGVDSAMDAFRAVLLFATADIDVVAVQSCDLD